jgi:gamma-glutamylcysteine synthetase
MRLLLALAAMGALAAVLLLQEVTVHSQLLPLKEAAVAVVKMAPWVKMEETAVAVAPALMAGFLWVGVLVGQIILAAAAAQAARVLVLPEALQGVAALRRQFPVVQFRTVAAALGLAALQRALAQQIAEMELRRRQAQVVMQAALAL